MNCKETKFCIIFHSAHKLYHLFVFLHAFINNTMCVLYSVIGHTDHNSPYHLTTNGTLSSYCNTFNVMTVHQFTSTSCHVKANAFMIFLPFLVFLFFHSFFHSFFLLFFCFSFFCFCSFILSFFFLLSFILMYFLFVLPHSEHRISSSRPCVPGSSFSMSYPHP